MIHSVIFDDQIKIWWDYNSKCRLGYGYKVVFDGTNIFTTDKYNMSFKNLLPETEHSFRVTLLDDKGFEVDYIGETTVKTLPAKENLDVTKAPYYAVGDGKTVNTKMLQKAIDDCKPNQKVYIPDGLFLTGALNLKSDTELYLTDGATLQGVTDINEYAPKVKCRFEGYSNECYRSLLNAGEYDEKGGYNCRNVVVRGGKILGGGDELRQNIIAYEAKTILKEQGLDHLVNPPFHYAKELPGRRRGRLFRTTNTQNVLIADCTIGEGPSWNLHFIFSDNVITCGCKVVSHRISNGDGWDPDSSTNCTIFDTHFDTGDDCVAIKSGKNLQGYLIGRPSRNIKVFDCTCEDGHGLAIGSEMSGGVEDVTIWNCDMMKAGTGICIKTNSMRGGFIKNVSVYNVKVPRIMVNNYQGNNDGDPAPCPPILENFTFENCEVAGLLKITGTERIEKVSAIQVDVTEDNKLKGLTIKNIKTLYNGLSPWQMLEISNVEDVTIENILCKGETEF